MDALWFAFRLLGIGAGDEALVPANTYIASVMGNTINGATPVFVEPDGYCNIDANRIEKKITDKTRVVRKFVNKNMFVGGCDYYLIGRKVIEVLERLDGKTPS